MCIVHVANATTIHFILNISDNCSPSGYSGYYCAVIKIKLNNTEYCEYRTCTLRQGNNDIQYDCEIIPYQENCTYTLDINICRYTDPLTCCKSDPKTNVCWSQFTSGTYTFYVTL